MFDKLLAQLGEFFETNIKFIDTEVHKAAKPPPKLSLSEWADQFRQLSAESSAEPGQWNTSRAEYQRGIMDEITRPHGKPIAIITSSQVGKTEIVNNIVGYHIDQDPSPILVLQPTLDMAETWSKDRLAPMIRDTPTITAKVADPKSRDSGNTLLHKKFVGGHLTVVGSNSAAGLASRPIRVVLADEVDRYPMSAGTEGDPLSLAIKRTATFWNRRIVMVSTPTIKGFSRIEAEWDQSDQRRYYVPCVHCGHKDHLQWANVRWPEGRPKLAAYQCPACEKKWTEVNRLHAIKNGEWRATVEGMTMVIGFHISELYSPWSTIPNMAEDFIKKQKTPETRKTFVNTSLGESYEDDAQGLDGHMLLERCEDWAPDGDNTTAPNDALLVTVGVDVQADRLEAERVAWGTDEESWSLEHLVLPGDPSDPELWKRLDAYLLEPTVRIDGRKLPVRATCIDSGGHHTQKVYKFCTPRKNRGVYAIKGREGALPVWPLDKSRKRKKSGTRDAKVTIVGVDSGKDTVYSNLKTTHAGPGFCHFPHGRPAGWFEQLTSEVVKTIYTRGFARRSYHLPQGHKNEALDCRVYAYAALQSLHVRWGTEHAAVKAQVVPKNVPEYTPKAAVVASQPAPKSVRRPGYLANRKSNYLRR